MLVAIVRFPKIKREGHMRKVLTNIRQDPNQVEDKVIKIKLLPPKRFRVKT
jgi:hypothetical protein